MRTPIVIALAILLAVPLAAAQTRHYSGGTPAHVGFCTDGLIDGDVGLGCDLVCNATCTVSVSDDNLGAVGFMVCDYDTALAADVRCVTSTGGSVTYTSLTHDIDVYVDTGTTGTITVA